MDARLQVYNDKMEKALAHLEGDYQTIRAGRANPHVLDKIKVDYYGTPTPLQQVGNISVPEPRMLQIAPWEKSLIKEIEKAIIKLADTEGIPIDVDTFNTQAAAFLKASESLTSYSPFGGTDNTYSLSTLFTLQSQANLLKQNHKL